MAPYAAEYTATPSVEPEVELGLQRGDLSENDAVVGQEQGEPRRLHHRITILCSIVALVAAVYVFASASGLKSSSNIAKGSSSEHRWLDAEVPKKNASSSRLSKILTAGPFHFVNKRRRPIKSVTPVNGALEPREHESDGNVCDDDEELYLGLCYSKCAILTSGTHPFRSNAFTCCETKECGLNIKKMKTASILPCNGYDTSDVNGGVGCPHSPGVCLKDEEQFLGECYETCSKLTSGAFPNRIAPLSCCKTDSTVGCLNPLNDWTSGQLAVGGGAGDHNDETPRKVHPPLESLTEANPPAAHKKENKRRRVAAHIKPDEHMHDGNACDDTEEFFGGMCYTKCSFLTDNKYPTRKSAFTCCAEPNCGMVDIYRMKTASLLPCKGFDVSSQDGGEACPHSLGTCLADEELFSGECFEKCDLLTNSKFPNRVAAATCCKSEGVACMNPFNDWTKASFAVGGGAGDHDEQTPQKAHFPLTSITEATA